MSDNIDQQARDDAKDARHSADMATQLIQQHITSCERAHAENSKKLDKMEGSFTRLHQRIDEVKDAIAAKAETQAGANASISTRQGVMWSVMSAGGAGALALVIPRLFGG